MARRHTNTKGVRQAKTGAGARALSRICDKLRLPRPKADFLKSKPAKAGEAP